MSTSSSVVTADNLSRARTVRSAATIRDRIRATEASGDQMLESSADLMKAMVSARRSADVDPHTGQKSLMRLAQAQRAIIAAQNDIFRVHEDLVGIATVMMPDEDGSTPPSGISDTEMDAFRELSAVA